MKIFIIVATSADGFIAKYPKEPSTNWTSVEDKKHFIETTKKSGAIVMGANTFKTIGRALPKRRNIVYSNEPINVPGIEVTSLAPQELIAKLEKEGVEELAICGGSTIYTMFMKAGLVDSLYLTIEPIIFGKGMNLFNDVIDAKLELVNFRRTDSGTIFNEYKVIK